MGRAASPSTGRRYGLARVCRVLEVPALDGLRGADASAGARPCPGSAGRRRRSRTPS